MPITTIRGATSRCLDAAALLLLLPVLVMVVACGSSVVKHEAYVTLNDPTRHLGSPPWYMSMDSPAG